ncbi:hypothetical protein BGZ59_003184 [Podila verticillata]|nr:hypothetical protein BGZ59_003184 [Podila verticillata]
MCQYSQALAVRLHLDPLPVRSNAIGTHCRPDLKGPRALPLLGHTLLMAKVPGTELYEFFEKLHDTYGPVWSISVPNVGRLIQGDTPEPVDYVLRTNFWDYEKSDLLRGILGDIFGTGITIADGHNWRFQRKMITRLFNVSAFREHVSDVFVAKGQKVVEYLGKAADEGTVADITSLLLNFALDAFGTICFGWDFGSMDSMEEESSLGHTFDSTTSICSKRALNPIWRIKEWMTGTDEKIRSGQHFVAEHMASIIQRRREKGFLGGKKDLLQLFLEATDDDGNPLSDSVTQDFIVNITVAGRDAVPQYLSWMIYCLHRTGSDPEVRENLVRETDEVLQGEQPTYDTYKSQKYTETCFHKSLRLFPVIPRNMKKCMKDDVIPDGTKIRAGDWFT